MGTSVNTAMKKLAISCLMLCLIILNLVLNLVKIILRPMWRIIMGKRIPVVVRTPEERFAGLEKLGYNFAPNYFSVDGGCGVQLPRVHYLDEGPRDGHVILCLHGEPSWSFLYRTMIPVLVQAGYRVVVPDFIGFGKSDKYTEPDNYSHELHCFVLRKLIDHLGVTDMTLVCQDWGGLTGLSVVKDVPDKFYCLVIMNTGLPAPIINFNENFGDPNKEALPFTKLFPMVLPFTLWRTFALLMGTNIPVRRLFNFAFKRYNLDPAIIAAYTAPFPSSLYQGGVAKWPLLVPMLEDDPVTAHMVEARDCIKNWNKPALVMFGDKDPITRGMEKLFLNLIPHARNIVVEGASHFLQETHGEIISKNIIQFLNEQN